MMIQVAIIGLDTFGIRMLQELAAVNADIIILDKSRDVIEKYKSLAKDAYISDAINDAVLRRIIPEDIDSVIVDVGSRLEVSIMVTNYLHKMGINNIIVKAETDEHGEILKLVGATKVVFPDVEAAKKLVPILASKSLFNYMEVSPGFALAELKVNRLIAGKTLLEANIRRNHGINVVAYREQAEPDFSFIKDTNFMFKEGQILLVAGTEEAINEYLGKGDAEQILTKKQSLFTRLFPKLVKEKSRDVRVKEDISAESYGIEEKKVAEKVKE